MEEGKYEKSYSTSETHWCCCNASDEQATIKRSVQGNKAPVVMCYCCCHTGTAWRQCSFGGSNRSCCCCCCWNRFKLISAEREKAREKLSAAIKTESKAEQLSSQANDIKWHTTAQSVCCALEKRIQDPIQHHCSEREKAQRRLLEDGAAIIQ